MDPDSGLQNAMPVSKMKLAGEIEHRTQTEFDSLERDLRRAKAIIAALEHQIDVLRYEKSLMCSVSEAVKPLIDYRKYVLRLQNEDFNALKAFSSDLSGVWARGYRKKDLGARLMTLQDTTLTICEIVPRLKVRLEKPYEPKSAYIRRTTPAREDVAERLPPRIEKKAS